MPGISQHFQKGLIKDAYSYLYETYDEYEEIWPRYIAERKVDGDHWQTTTVVNSGIFRKTGETEGYQVEQAKEGFTVYGRIHDWTTAMSFSYNTVKDHQKTGNLLKTLANGWGVNSKETRETFYARPFNKGGLIVGDWIFNGTPESKAVTDTSGDGCYDGTAAAIVPFFCLTTGTNQHVGKDGVTHYNGHALALTPDNLTTILTHAESNNNRRENGTRFRLEYDTIVYPSDLDDTVRKILESTLVPYGSTNTKNTLQNRLNPIKNPYLDDSDAFFVGCKPRGNTEVGWRGLVALNRQEPVIDFFEEKRARCYMATAEMRIGFMANNYRYWSGSQFSTA